MPRALLPFVIVLAAAGCAGSETPDGAPAAAAAADCVERVLRQDGELAAVRNHAPKQMPLADAVGNYVAGLAGLDFSGCPAGFTDAFARHRSAWFDAVEFLGSYDTMRGEMHDLFEQIRAESPDAAARLSAHEQAIWSTWAEVESAGR
ncbi:MAG TPA: hypothetical protein VD788_09645 [Candidatus Polarisedimenticolaceae bacterium]|nr:hypothetical protein [Candidatus Polarisedimenticolaceae bacterium]